MLFLQCPRCAKPLPGHANYCRRCGCPVRPASPSVTPSHKPRRQQKSGRGWLVILALMGAFFMIRLSATRHSYHSEPTNSRIRLTPSKPVYITAPPVEEDSRDRRPGRKELRRPYDTDTPIEREPAHDH